MDNEHNEKKKVLDVTNYEFPQLSDIDVAFSQVSVDFDLLEEAKARGFYNGNTKYNDLFSNLFFKGGKLDFKDNLNKEFENKATRYLKALMGSFEPSHEVKEAICALLLSELVK